MQSPRQRILLKVCCYLGITLLYLPNDLNWYWGNLVVYVDSYVYAHHPESANQAPWLISLFVTSWGVALLLGAYLNKRLDQFAIAVLGAVVYDAGLLVSYLSVQQSMYLLDLTMGVVCGLGYGLIQAMVYLWVQDLVNRNVALAYALVTNCLNLGAMLINQLITLYINPGNVEAQTQILMSKLFTDRSVIDKVPSMFLVLGTCVFAFHFTGLVFVRIAYYRLLNVNDFVIGNDDDEKQERADTVSETQPIHIKHKMDLQGSMDGGDQFKPKDLLSFDQGVEQTHYDSSQSSQDSCCPQNEEYEHIHQEKPGQTVKLSHKAQSSDSDSDTDPNRPPNYTLKEALRTKAFYLLCFTLLAADLCYITSLNFYKKFGELRIHNDHFLTEIGTASSLCVLVMRLVWGCFMDRYGLKCSTVVFTSSIAVFFLTYFPSLYVSRWLYAVWTVALGNLCTALYLVFPVASLRLFGATNFADIYGAVMSTTIFTNIVAPMVLETVLLRLGWFGLFTGIGLLSGIVLLAVILGLSSD